MASRDCLIMMQRKDFHQRGGGEYRWKRSRPYHVALEDGYIRARWGFIYAVCKMNSLPFDGTGERIQRDGTWCVYEFAVRLDATQFWDRSTGAGLSEGFIYPDRPKGLPKLREPVDTIGLDGDRRAGKGNARTSP